MNKLIWIPLAVATIIFACSGKKDDPSPAPVPEAKEQVVEISTGFGKMYMWLYKETPQHRTNFLKLADSGFFDNTTFHRCVDNFVIQGGDPNSKDSDPNNDGNGGPGYTIPAEFVDSIKHIRGAVGAARDNNPAKASNGSQFYVVLSEQTTQQLNGNYTVFGYIMKGMNVADSIVKQPKNGAGRPYTNIPMTVKVLNKTKSEIKSLYGYEVK
ncbi:MAG: peptidylprolyl isomerase [Bacteroidia bacterium]|nr:peptidylprolyl isomerase [Bacteroidia bacterium]